MNSAYLIIAFYIFIIGICIGSFLNVVILRGLAQESFVFSRSKCPKCGNQLTWYMNIPLFSYIFLRGKYEFCKEKISPQYHIVEFITGVAFLGSFIAFGFSLKTLFICAFLSLFIVLAVCDILETVIIEQHTYILYGLGILYSILNLGDVNWIWSILGGIFSFLFLELLARFGLIVAGYRTFGDGDSFIVLGFGSIFGFLNTLIIIALAVLIQGLSYIFPLLIQTFKNKDYKLFASYCGVIFLVGYITLVNYFKVFELGLIELIVLLILGIFIVFNILKSIRNKVPEDFDEAKTKFNIIPFGPALIIAATVCLFWLPQIKNIVTTIFPFWG